MTPIPKPKQPAQPKQKNERDSPLLVRQPDDTLLVFGPDLDDFNLCNDPC